MKAAFLCKTMLVLICAKILHRSFIPKIYKNFKSVFFQPPSANENFQTCMQD